MKKLTVLLLAWLLLFSFAGAEETVYAVIDLDGVMVDVEQEMPEDVILLLRDSSASVFNRAGLFQPEAVAWMEEANAYALIFPASEGWEARVLAYNSDMGNLEDTTDFGMQSILADLEWIYADAGYTDVQTEACWTPWHRMIRLAACYEDEAGQKVWLENYITFLFGKEITFQLISLDAPPSEELSAWLRSLVDHIWIYEAE